MDLLRKLGLERMSYMTIEATTDTRKKTSKPHGKLALVSLPTRSCNERNRTSLAEFSLDPKLHGIPLKQSNTSRTGTKIFSNALLWGGVSISI